MADRGVPIRDRRASHRRRLRHLGWCATVAAVALVASGCNALWSFGANGSAQLGLGDATSVSTPEQVGTAEDWTAVASGSTISMPIPGLPDDTVDIDHTCAIRLDASLWCWGYRVTQAFPAGYYDTDPVRVGTATWKAVTAGAGHNCAIKADGTLWCWGDSTFGQVGDGTVFSLVTQPVQVGTQQWTAVAAGATHTCGIQVSGSLWCWGSNADGQVGTGAAALIMAVPAQVGTSTWKSVSADGRITPSVRVGHTCAVRSDDTLWCWGSNGSGQVGNGTTSAQPVPAQVQVLPVEIGTVTWSSVEVGATHTCAVRSAASLWCWGANADGQLGDGTTTDRLNPVRAGDRYAYVGCSDSPPFIFCTSPWASVTGGGRHTCGVRFDHSLWCWGENSSGQLGDGGSTDRPVPAQVGTDTSWNAVSAGGNHTEALHG